MIHSWLAKFCFFISALWWLCLYCSFYVFFPIGSSFHDNFFCNELYINIFFLLNYVFAGYDDIVTSLGLSEAQSLCSSSANDAYSDFHNDKYLKFKCSLCSKSFPRQWHLQNHIRVHTGVRPFKCQHCNKSFNQLGNLNTHMKIHTGEKEFKCDHCNYCSYRLKDIKIHMMSKHFL